MEATIVKLGPSDKLVGVVTFEEAFGEHSELRGRGRARRQKKRLKRISDRAERKRARQAMRKEQQASRQERKDIRKTRRVARKSMGDEEDGEEDLNSVNQQDEVQSSEQSYSQPEYNDAPAEEEGYEESYQETEEEPEPYDFENGESGADGEESSEARGGRRGGRGARRGNGLGARMRARRAERRAAPIEAGEAAANQEMESSVDGDFMDGENLSAATGGKAVQQINPQIRDTTKRIVWNREALRRHKGNHAKFSNEYKQKMQMPAYRAKPNHPYVAGLREAIQKHEMEIQKHEQRLESLERTLAEKFSGHPHIEHGYKLANIELQKQIEGERNGQTRASIKDTIVEKGLGAEIEKNRIDVPAQPEMRTVELSSSADGSEVVGSMSTPTKLIIGAAALGLAYYFAKKYKVI